MRARVAILASTVALLALVAGASAQAATGPIYDIRATWGDTNLPPGGEAQLILQVRNVGDADGEGPIVIEDQLPAGVTVTAVVTPGRQTDEEPLICSGVHTETVRCEPNEEWAAKHKNEGLLRAPGRKTVDPGALFPSGYLPKIYVDLEVDAGASGTGVNTASVSGGGGPPASDVDQVFFSSAPSAFGLRPGFLADYFDAEYPFGGAVRQAAGHPFELRVDFDLNARSQIGEDGTRYVAPHGLIKTVEATLPRGAAGNPEAIPKCDPVDFAEQGATLYSTACPANTQLGYLNVRNMSGEAVEHGQGRLFFNGDEALAHIPIYNLVPPKGALADLAFNAGTVVQGHIYPTLDAEDGYAIVSTTPEISSLVQVLGAEVTLWGVPGDPAHDRFRYYPELQPNGDAVGAPFAGAPIRPFLTSPSDCGIDNGGTRFRVDSYQDPGHFTPTAEYGNPMNVTGCADPRIRFEPEVSVQPTSTEAGGPTGLDVNLKLPQRNDEVKDATELYPQNGFVKSIATPPMKKVVVTLPEGMTVSPSAAQGLGVCTTSQVGIDPRTAIPNNEPADCPADSQYGTLRLKSPALPQSKVITGRLYVAQPYQNPFGSFLALYFVIDDEDLGLRVKLAGEVRLDPQTGQITTEFDDIPQLPASEVEVKVKGGLRAGLVNPQTCGKKMITATFYSWHDRSTPHAVTNSYEISGGPGGTPCFNSLSERPFEPSFAAGTTNPLAGAFAPLEVDFSRSDTDQDLLAAQGTAPQGLLASLRGIGRCSEAQIAAAANPGRSGIEELSSPSCPVSSQVGTVDAGAGVGQVLTYVKGKVYLAGPYKGAPASGVAIVPAVAGPFDLGVVVTRAPAYIDPVTAQLSLKTDPLPLIFKGVPVRVRDVRVHLDHPNFALNPTSCEAMSIGATLQSSEGKSKDASQPFQVGSCAELGFKPRLSLRLRGGTRRGAHPALRAVFRPREGDANTARIQVTLPHSAFLDQAHIRTICTRALFAAAQGHGEACPQGSVYGHVRAITPLLDDPLEGPVYLRSSSHKLPDLVATVSGPSSLPVHFESAARIDSVGGGIRSTFSFFPDVPLTEAVLTMQGAKKGLVINSRNLCAGASRAKASLVAHNGKRSDSRPEVVAGGCPKKHRPRSAR